MDQPAPEHPLESGDSEEILLAWVCGDLDATRSAVVEDRLESNPELLRQVLDSSEMIAGLGASFGLDGDSHVLEPRVWMQTPRRVDASRVFLALAIALFLGVGTWFVVGNRESAAINSWVFHLDLAYADDTNLLTEDSEEFIRENGVDLDEPSDLADLRDEPLSWIAVAVRESQGVQE